MLRTILVMLAIIAMGASYIYSVWPDPIETKTCKAFYIEAKFETGPGIARCIAWK